MTLGWLISQLFTKPVLSVVSSLNGYLLVFLILGLVLHGTPRKFLQAVAKAVPATGGILVQFPLYAAMAAILTKAKGSGGQTVSDQLADLFTSIGGGGAFAVVIALYTVVLGIFVPSGGGKWLVEAPYVMQSATDVQMNLGWTVQIYNVAEALPNLINPFFMLPLLAVLGLRARDLVGFTFLQFIFHLPVVLAAGVAARNDIRLRPPCRARCTVKPSLPGLSLCTGRCRSYGIAGLPWSSECGAHRGPGTSAMGRDGTRRWRTSCTRGTSRRGNATMDP